MWILVILLAAALVSNVAGLLVHASGANVPFAVLAGGGAFGTTVLLLLAIGNFLEKGSR
ncbi:hypothetical protein O7622_05540 [Micromonospora sp. WMMD1076]|uniref:hypothetical protein n=1 Tax=Micromonospora sp. WMMD1076 TaxID=3016103 RepID=UPI00249CF196|nr:hypothetical protein [Micromonospora sp. WMMD1076]WFF08037.1 hypothetical protein O7622_05540 [Micromonospora sp. WMMD1076]